jgi:hypothetical protein
MNPICLALLALCPSQTVLGNPAALDAVSSDLAKLSQELPLSPQDAVKLAPPDHSQTEPGSPVPPGVPTPEEQLAATRAAEQQQRDEEDAAFCWDLAIACACGALVAMLLGMLAIGVPFRFRPARARP